MFPNGTREASVPWIKGRTAGPLSQSSQSGVSLLKTTQAIPALGGFQPLIRPSANPEFMSGRFSVDPQSCRVCVEINPFFSRFLLALVIAVSIEIDVALKSHVCLFAALLDF